MERGSSSPADQSDFADSPRLRRLRAAIRLLEAEARDEEAAIASKAAGDRGWLYVAEAVDRYCRSRRQVQRWATLYGWGGRVGGRLVIYPHLVERSARERGDGK